MRSITYASTASHPFGEEELVSMLERWVPANRAAGVTGMLLYGAGHLMQLIEGPDEIVTALLDRIVDDPRHHDVFVVVNEPVAEREFPDWSMGFRKVSDLPLEEVDGYREPLSGPEPTVHVGGASASQRMLDLFRAQWV